jgi:dihydroneopterin aldolase
VDIIFLKDLRVEAIIGIFDWERRATQTVSLDLEMATDVARAAESDSIEAALNYKLVAKRLVDYVESSEFQLVETLAENVARIVVTEFAVPWVKVSVAKPAAITGSREVGVVITRDVDSYG